MGSLVINEATCMETGLTPRACQCGSHGGRRGDRGGEMIRNLDFTPMDWGGTAGRTQQLAKPSAPTLNDERGCDVLDFVAMNWSKDDREDGASAHDDGQLLFLPGERP